MSAIPSSEISQNHILSNNTNGPAFNTRSGRIQPHASPAAQKISSVAAPAISSSNAVAEYPPIEKSYIYEPSSPQLDPSEDIDVTQIRNLPLFDFASIIPDLNEPLEFEPI